MSRGIGVVVLVLASAAAAQEPSWSQRFPAIAQRVAHLDRRLTAEDATIRKRVLTELTYFRPRDHEVYPPFLCALLKDASPEVRGDAVKLLSDHHVHLGADELPDSFNVPLIGDFRWKDPAQLERVRDIAGSVHAATAGWAIYALGFVGDEKAIPLARALLESKNVFVRHSAALALVQLGQRREGMEALHRITEAVDDQTGCYRYRAAEDLMRCGDRTAIDVLIGLMEGYGDYASGPREILEDLTGEYFLTAAEARAWRQENSCPTCDQPTETVPAVEQPVTDAGRALHLSGRALDLGSSVEPHRVAICRACRIYALDKTTPWRALPADFGSK